MEDRYYMDYRLGAIVKNLDTAFLAPEMYNEVIVDASLAGTYQYKYEDAQGRRLGIMFTVEQVMAMGFDVLLKGHCKKHEFEPREVVQKIMYITQKQFDELYLGKK